MSVPGRAPIVGLWLAVLLLAGCAGSSAGNVDQEQAARSNTRLAGDYLRNGDLDNARKYFQKALKYDPKRLNALWGLAVVNNRVGRTGRAAHYYQRAMSVKQSPQIVNSYAAFLCQHDNVDKAIPLFNQVAKDASYSSPGIPLANAGLCLMQSGRPRRARQYFNKALARNKNQLLALTQLAHLALDSGNTLRARTYIRRVEQNGELTQAQLKLAARIEQAAGNRRRAREYIARYNKNANGTPLSLDSLRSDSR